MLFHSPYALYKHKVIKRLQYCCEAHPCEANPHLRDMTAHAENEHLMQWDTAQANTIEPPTHLHWQKPTLATAKL